MSLLFSLFPSSTSSTSPPTIQTSIPTKNYIKTLIKQNPPNRSSNLHPQNLHSLQKKPRTHLRSDVLNPIPFHPTHQFPPLQRILSSWVLENFPNCLNLFLLGVTVSSSLFPFNPIAHALETSSIHLGYPCEDVRGYYSGIGGLRGAALKEKLGALVYDHKPLTYKEVWEALKILDATDIDNPEASSEVIEIYSLRAVPKALAGKPDGWNREHLWPRSYGLMNGPSLTDLHNIRPADVNVNSSRGNKYYGECVGISTHCQRPANREAASDTETDKQRWAPPLQVRGDIARSIMYMAVCYGFLQPDGNPHLQLSDTPSIERREMGLLSELLQWNELDPPSREEQLRNNRICNLYQHNRNPFVDHPDYANLIWKHSTFGSTPAAYSPSLKAWINEFHCDNKGKDQNEGSSSALLSCSFRMDQLMALHWFLKQMMVGLKFCNFCHMKVE